MRAGWERASVDAEADGRPRARWAAGLLTGVASTVVAVIPAPTVDSTAAMAPPTTFLLLNDNELPPDRGRSHSPPRVGAAVSDAVSGLQCPVARVRSPRPLGGQRAGDGQAV